MNVNSTKEPYIKPESEIVNLELEQPILSGSNATGNGNDFGDGGFWD